MKTYSYILLDWDGNIAKTLDIWLEAIRASLLRRNIKKSDLQIALSFGLIEEYMRDWGVKDIDIAMNEAHAFARQRLPFVELYPEALQVLEKLYEMGKHLALITSSQHEHIVKILNRYDLEKYFDTIIARDDVSHHKPHPEPLEKALKQLNGSKENAIMIGDSDKDIGAANSLGVDSILFYPEEHKKYYDFSGLKKQKPTYIVSRFQEILHLV